ncbi:dephospho-CoA kinase [Lysinibacter sp. HNR]|uniref:dephospho-CoA kinase n=1 Tax=Lysinibacter sp. HNR TaxID=3031408 RepID=UPI002435CACD|nr:dephospho-CoA kinase [Lysinibacter sp. HNR]WGD36176.1 dephospho-CoA kinase [Lysinibacter sp. HNR]
MYLIGLTGGIAAGKSTVSRRLAERGAYHLDADAIARIVVEPGSRTLDKIAYLFGPDVIAEDGSLNRAALGAIVFQNQQALSELNAIIHPEVQKFTRERIAEITRSDPHAVIVYDVPLLVEARVDHPWNLVVTVEAPSQVRIDRLMQLRGFSRAQAEARVAQQATEAERRAVAQVVIDSSGTEEQTIAQADELWERVTSEASQRD